MKRHAQWPAVATLAALAAVGCGKPNRAAIELRKQNTALKEQIVVLKNQQAADLLTISALRAGSPLATTTLPPERIDTLFTATGLQFGRLTAGVDADGGRPGAESVRVYLAPVDADGQVLKAAGTTTIRAYPPEGSAGPVGEWVFPLADARKYWFGKMLLNEYVFDLPLPADYTADAIRLAATFEDGLTGRVIGPVEKVVSLKDEDLVR